MFLAMLFLILGGGLGFAAAKKLSAQSKFDSEDMAVMLEQAAKKFLIHANKAHIGDGGQYEGDLRYARSFMLEAHKIRQEEERNLMLED